MDTFAKIVPILDTMSPITLEEMESVKLMNRVDDKYIFDEEVLKRLLESIAPEYYVQRINGEALAPYHTLYFDTEDLEMYTMHHNRRLFRQKVRVRCYEISGTTFLEIKKKNNKGKTKKKRIEVGSNHFEDCLSSIEAKEFLSAKSAYGTYQLHPQLENRFTRITLVDKGMHERVTIDGGLLFLNRTTLQNKELNGLVVMEVKRELGGTPTAIDKALIDLRIKPKRISKYCIGTAFTNPQAKSNRFKAKMMFINKLINHQ